MINLIQGFPALHGSGYLRTSKPTTGYNCIAWAAGDSTKWWQPSDPFGLGLCYWPKGIPKTESVSSVIRVFRSLGYKKCDNGALEAEIEKLAIFTKGQNFKHVARQLSDGNWTSKLGPLDDISHPLEALSGVQYGTPTIFLCR